VRSARTYQCGRKPKNSKSVGKSLDRIYKIFRMYKILFILKIL